MACQRFKRRAGVNPQHSTPNTQHPTSLGAILPPQIQPSPEGLSTYFSEGGSIHIETSGTSPFTRGSPCAAIFAFLVVKPVELRLESMVPRLATVGDLNPPPSLRAHTPAFPGGPWHGLIDHLQTVARLCQESAAKFGFGDLGTVLGLAHDLGKADDRFQRYLVACAEGRHASSCPHAVPSAKALLSELRVFCLPVVGHHMGLKNLSEVKNGYLANADSNTVSAAAALWLKLRPTTRLDLPADGAMTGLETELLIRMLFSCLVDADFVDTERHFDASKGAKRGTRYEIAQLAETLRNHMATFGRCESVVSQVRTDVLDSCRKAASSAPGVFRLTVPTGGGKTLASLTFALDHATEHELDRVIVAIPYTSIIDQTADVYERIFDAGAVLEHHSAIELDVESESPSEQEVQRRLAAENWDAPIIVTTTVQLFESLFASRTSRCRKLHNIARSVIILDEIQTLPPNLLEPILDVLGQLVARYSCSVVLCTATQPDFSELKGKLSHACYQLLVGASEIVPSPERHFEILRRVTFESDTTPIGAEEIASRVGAQKQVLCVLNTRRDAVRVLKACKERGGLYHLSTLLCPHHRKRVIAEVKRRLASDEEVKVVSTQVVEAGVDIDFPFVMRVVGPLDRIVQVAGRCNRGGRPERGRCFVFELEGGSSPTGSYRTGLDLTRTILRENITELDQPPTVSAYFRAFYRHVETDSPKVQEARARLAYEEVSQCFRMIEDRTTAFLVESYRPADQPDLVANLLGSYMPWNAREWLRKVRQFAVAVPDHEVRALSDKGWITQHDSGMAVYSGPYDDLFGIGFGEERDSTDLTI